MIEVEVGPTVAVEVASGHDLIAMEAPVQRGEAHVAQAVGAALAVPDMTVDPGAEVGPVHVQVVRSVAVEVAGREDLVSLVAAVQGGLREVGDAIRGAVPDVRRGPCAQVAVVQVHVGEAVAVEVRRGQHFIAHPRRVERIQPVDPGVVPGRQAGLIGCAVVHDRLRVVRADVGFTFDRLR